MTNYFQLLNLDFRAETVLIRTLEIPTSKKISKKLLQKETACQTQQKHRSF